MELVNVEVVLLIYFFVIYVVSSLLSCTSWSSIICVSQNCKLANMSNVWNQKLMYIKFLYYILLWSIFFMSVQAARIDWMCFVGLFGMDPAIVNHCEDLSLNNLNRSDWLMIGNCSIIEHWATNTSNRYGDSIVFMDLVNRKCSWMCFLVFYIVFVQSSTISHAFSFLFYFNNSVLNLLEAQHGVVAIRSKIKVDCYYFSFTPNIW